MPNLIKVYECKHFCWTSWNQYGQKMWEYGCKLKSGGLSSCEGICSDFGRRADDA